jgi:hypothetical protein
MKRIKLLGLVAAIAGMVFSIQAQTDYTTPERAQTSPPPDNVEDNDLYHGCEFSVDAFGVAALRESDFNNGNLAKKDLRWGGGLGINFFLTKYIGVGGDAYAIANHNGNSFVDTTTGNLIIRVPIADTGLAPYIFGGAGYQFEGIDQIVGGPGVGLEFRPVQHFSIFVDARFLFAAKTDNYGLARAGIRLSF